MATVSGDVPKSSPALKMEPKDFEAGLAEATTEELETLLVRLNNWNRSAVLYVKIRRNNERVKVANALMLHPLGRQQRNLAITSKLEAQSAIYGMEFMQSISNPNIPSARGANLRATAEKYLHDSDPEISQAAKLALLKVDAFETVEDPRETDPQALAEKANQMLTEYPDNDFVISNVKLILDAMLKFRKPFGMDLIRELLELSQENQSASVEKLRQYLRDEVQLSDLKYSQQIEDIWVNGDKGQRELFKISVMLARQPSGGEKIVSSVNAVANWFEQYNQYERTNKSTEPLSIRLTPALSQTSRQSRCDWETTDSKDARWLANRSNLTEASSTANRSTRRTWRTRLSWYFSGQGNKIHRRLQSKRFTPGAVIFMTGRFASWRCALIKN